MYSVDGLYITRHGRTGGNQYKAIVASINTHSQGLNSARQRNERIRLSRFRCTAVIGFWLTSAGSASFPTRPYVWTVAFVGHPVFCLLSYRFVNCSNHTKYVLNIATVLGMRYDVKLFIILRRSCENAPLKVQSI